MTPEAKVGLLVLTGLLILIYLTLKVGTLGFGSDGGYQLQVFLDDASGLAKDSAVVVAGISVGVVESVELEGGRARLGLRIQDSLRLPVDSSASLRTQGVLGEKYVEIRPGGSTQLLAEGGTLRTGAPPGDLDQLVSSLSAISADVKQVTERLARVFGTDAGEQQLREIVSGLRDTAVGLGEVVRDNRDALHASLGNLAQLTAELRELVAVNRAGIDDTIASTRAFTRTLAERTPEITENLAQLTGELGAVVAENRTNLRTSLENLRDASARLNQTLGSVDGLVQAAGGDGTLGKLIRDDSLYDDLSGAATDLSAVLARLESGEGTLGKLLTDDAAYEELSGGLASLRSISTKIDQGDGTIGKLVNDDSVHENLNQTLEGISEFIETSQRFQFELGYRGEYLVRRGDTKSYFSLDILPRQDRFYHLAIVDDPNGLVKKETTQFVVTDASGTRTETEEKRTTTDRWKFSAQVGKRFSYLTVRGGLFESAGGVGADLDLFSDRLRLTFEAFDFGRDEGPTHLKAGAQWTLLKHFYLAAGFDDFLDDRGRAEYFVGGGLRFLDEDLKFLLSPAASAIQ
jgi:phospholipid/cholesterol/gamma-HCH transport system substrate-binding protein